MCGVLGHLDPVHRCARSLCFVACAVSWAAWLLFSNALTRCVALRVQCPGTLGSCSPVCPLGLFCCVCGVLGHLAPVHRCAPSVRCVACAVSWATWLVFTLMLAPCVVLRVRCPGPLASCSPVCPLRALCCVCGVLGHLAPVHRCARSVRCVACAVSWATWLQFTNALTRCVELRVRCAGPLGSCPLVCSLSLLCSMCGVLRHLAPVHRSVRSVRCVACVVSWATCLLFTNALAPCVVLCVRFPETLGSCSPVCSLSVLCCIACAVSLASWLLFSGVLARCVALRVRCPGPLGSCSPVCPLGALCCACGVLGHLAPVHRCARSVRCVACAVSWGTWLLFTGLSVRCVVLRVRCPGRRGSCSRVCSLGALCCVCGVVGHLSPVHGCARSVRCVACGVSWGTWLFFIGLSAWCVALRVWCSGPLGSCSPVCPLGALCYVCGVLGHLAPVHRCARSVRCVACAVLWATCLQFTDVLARCVVLRAGCPGALGSSSSVCPLGAWRCVCGVRGQLAPVHRAVGLMRAVACVVSWATWLLFTGVLARCVVLRVRCPGPLGSCSPVCPLDAWCCVCGVLGHLTSLHRCARSVRCVACAVSPATWLLFTCVPARCAVLCVRCAGPLGSCSPMRSLGALCCVCGFRGHLAPVHRCARSVCCVACAVSWATWLCGVSLRGAHSSIRMAAMRSRQGLGTLRACTRPSARRLVCSRQGLGTLPGAHSSIWTAAVL